ncbi:hypothetical protein CGCA056_v009010 [Colletotrichum aenigma]|uniref:uncharacterized protein n=1 Tax=Colletotrichum aenigma TaxID=1215731 RepID=UPI001872B906|nr:uncharacterized protein CGCA056_v009010 [Colletotrichum aenigma]KAF5521054.1 hypothetical protein CGCA056_v009010 [Colletotrichum aenigma]
MKRVVKYTKDLAREAIVALDNSSTASNEYTRWFSYANANRIQLFVVNTSSFEVMERCLQAPSGTVKSYEEDSLSLQRLVYGFPPAGAVSCRGEVVASTVHTSDQFFGINTLIDCHSFFKKPSTSEMLSNCRKGKYSSFVGMILLHKMQHVNTIISQGKRCVDPACSSRRFGFDSLLFPFFRPDMFDSITSFRLGIVSHYEIPI